MGGTSVGEGEETPFSPGVYLFAIAFSILALFGVILYSRAANLSGSSSTAAFVVPTDSVKNAFADYVVTSDEGYPLSSAATIYYLCFPAGSINGNPEELYLISDGEFLRTTAGFNTEGGALTFSEKSCSSSTPADFSAGAVFGRTNAFDLSRSPSVCVNDGKETYDLLIVSYTDSELVFAR